MDRMSTLNLVNTIIRRKRLKITVKQILIGTCPCKRKSSLLDRKNKTVKNQKIFDKAQKMLNKQFDVTNLLRMVNLTQVLLSALLTREEQLLLLFQRRQIVETGDEDEIDSDQSFTKNFQSKISSKNPWDRIFVIGKTFNILKGLEDTELNAVSRKLIKGIYHRELNEYQYLLRRQEI